MWEECLRGQVPAWGLLLFLGWGGLRGWEQGCEAGNVQAGSLRGLTWMRASITGGFLEEAAHKPPAESGGGWPGPVTPSKAVWRAFGSPSCGLARGRARAEGLEGRLRGAGGGLGAREPGELTGRCAGGLWSGGQILGQPCPRRLRSHTPCPPLPWAPAFCKGQTEKLLRAGTAPSAGRGGGAASSVPHRP